MTSAQSARYFATVNVACGANKLRGWTRTEEELRERWAAVPMNYSISAAKRKNWPNGATGAVAVAFKVAGE